MKFFVPGRLEIFGKHTDYAGGRSLVAALIRGITVTAEARDDGRVIVEDEAGGLRAAFAVNSDLHGAVGWERYPATVIARLRKNFPHAPLSAELRFRSNLPHAAGMSSSSALLIAVAEALVERGGIERADAWGRDIQSVEDRAAYYACIENGAPFRSLEGEAGVGTHGGSEDHAAILGARAGHLTQFAFAPLRRERDVALPGHWTFAIATTGIEARKTEEARAAYNRLSDPALMTGARLAHFVAEDARVPLAADAFAGGDAAAVGALAEASQADAEALLRNQVPETRALVDLARDTGALAASGFGAGWGGSVWALVARAEAEAFLARWLAAYRRAHPHLAPVGFVSPPSDGLTRLT